MWHRESDGKADSKGAENKFKRMAEAEEYI